MGPAGAGTRPGPGGRNKRGLRRCNPALSSPASPAVGATRSIGDWRPKIFSGERVVRVLRERGEGGGRV